ncbi:hypothetical protein AHAS_Ahas19G0107100 [Arachis hypogaea]
MLFITVQEHSAVPQAPSGERFKIWDQCDGVIYIPVRYLLSLYSQSQKDVSLDQGEVLLPTQFFKIDIEVEVSLDPLHLMADRNVTHSDQ